MAKRAFLSERNAAQILRRYSAVTVMGLLREVAKCENARLDWDVLVRKSNTGISSAREYQALWRHIAYRAELADFYADDAKLSEDESDLEFELLPSPAVSPDADAEVVRWVKADMHRFDTGGKKKGETLGKSKSRDVGFPVVSKQAHVSSDLNGIARNGSNKRASSVPSVAAAGDSCAASPPPTMAGQVASASPECNPRQASGQSERKKRKLWSLEEDLELISAVEKFGEGNWTNILKGSFTHERTAAQLSQRWALIRKRREVKAAANRLASSPADAQGNGMESPSTDTSLRTSPPQNGHSSVSVSPSVLPSTVVSNGSVKEVVAPSTAIGSLLSSGSQSQAHVSSSMNTSPGGTGVNTAINGSVPTTGCMDSSAIKGEIIQPEATSVPAGACNGQWQTTQAGGASRSTSGCSTAVAAMTAGQGHSAGAKSVSTGVGAGRLIAPGALVMSAAAAQAASVGGSEMWQAATVPTAGAPTLAPAKYVVRSNSGGAGGRSMSTKPLTGPDPGVQAAAVAAGARIAPASTAASLLKAAHHSGNVVHIRPGGVPITKSGSPSQAGMGHNASVGSRASSGAIVHYIRTGAGVTPSTQQGVVHTSQRPAQQTKNQQSVKASGGNQTVSVAPNASNSSAVSNPASNALAVSNQASQPK